MCTDTILDCLPNDVKGILTKTFEKELSLQDWQKHNSSWDVLLTEETRKQFIILLHTLQHNGQFSHLISEMVEIYNESYGEDLIDKSPSDNDLLEILRHIFIYEIVGLGRQDLEINQSSKSAKLQLHIEVPISVKELQSIPENVRSGYGFSFHLTL